MDDVEVATQPSPPPPSGPVEHHREPLSSSPYPSFVYALGRVEPRFPSLATEKEFAQVTGQSETAGQTDQQVMQSILADRANRYLARELCWVFTIDGLETYVLAPRDPADFDSLVATVRPSPKPSDMDLVVGVRGPVASQEACNGLMVPVVAFDLLYSFDRDTLVNAIPKPDALRQDEQDQFGATAEELFDRLIRITENSGATDEHRALNYLAVRYPAIYSRAVEAHSAESSLTAVDAHPSPLGATRKLIDVIFSFTHRRTDVTEKYFVRVDTTGKYPFLATKLSPYYERP